jgi:predicted RecB family nuclease
MTKQPRNPATQRTQVTQATQTTQVSQATQATQATHVAQFSPTDLNHFLECAHLIQLERGRDRHARRGARDAHADLLAEKGAEHERAWFERFREEGLAIVSIDSIAAERDWLAEAARTGEAMRRGADIIYQAVFADGEWRGISDFLVRIDTPSALGSWSYEAWDTKLARRAKPYFVLQLCFYTEQLGRIQGLTPEMMVVVLGNGKRERLRYCDFDAYYRSVRRRFVSAVEADLPTYPYPVGHCGLCEYHEGCEQRWDADDHLSRVAGIRRAQVQRLNEAGIQTVAELGAIVGLGLSAPADDAIVGRGLMAPADATRRIRIGPAALDRLRHQASLQAGHRQTGMHRYELLDVDERSGFRLMPVPSPGDIFFDMEGDPYFEPARGLEYLFGVMTQGDFCAFQALTRAEEKIAFERFVDLVHARLREWPGLHVYHYAAYEPSALKRLMSEHATREAEVDDLLRREVFVDLYQVVRQSIRTSHRSYSIKKVRSFFMDGAGQGAVSDGGDSILEFERWRRTGDPAILQAIIEYNKEDCDSTLRLRDWLLERKAEAEQRSGTTIPWKETKEPEESPKRVEEDAATRARREHLLEIGQPLLADLLNYHRREAKPAYWAYFERRGKSMDDLIDDTEAIAELTAATDEQPEVAGRSVVYQLDFPPQEYKLGAGDQVDDPFRAAPAGTIVRVDGGRGRLWLKRGARRHGEPLPAALVSSAPLDNSAQRKALGRVADSLVDCVVHRPSEIVVGQASLFDDGVGIHTGRLVFSAIRDILERTTPRVKGLAPRASLQTLELDVQMKMVASLDSSYLLIQGPPGSGKTFTAARIIVSLIAGGKRIGVAANSHKAINNLLAEVEAVAAVGGVTFAGLKKNGKEDDEFDGLLIDNTTENAACESPTVRLVAGTSWLFSREEMEQSLDYLFIDEAGQVSLADAVAMATSSRNVVLLGDPQQLPQVRQGVHPGTSGCSILEHLLDGHATIAGNRGIFLARTWRMHPDICGFISDLAYDGRLVSAEGLERQRVDSRGLSGTGLRYLPVEHEGNGQQSPEEARVIAAEIAGILRDGKFTDARGNTRVLTPADILVVAPYNMQVRCLREALPDGIEVGTVDKFQGREAPVVFFSMASSSGEDVPRGLEFLFSRNRFNVAISRARVLAVVACSPRLFETRCRTVEQMRLVNALCRFAEQAISSQETRRPRDPHKR